MEYYIR